MQKLGSAVANLGKKMTHKAVTNKKQKSVTHMYKIKQSGIIMYYHQVVALAGSLLDRLLSFMP